MLPFPYFWGTLTTPMRSVLLSGGILTSTGTLRRNLRLKVGFPLYEFAGATLTSVPEPGTIILLSTGMLPVVFGVGRRCKSNMLKIVSPRQLS